MGRMLIMGRRKPDGELLRLREGINFFSKPIAFSLNIAYNISEPDGSL